ncbi:MAG TPA: hypothetical protein VKT72_12455, partial [Candidatus Baltobacteraceae bacterium]|nr:hypothetical protein [Candidatus Baltobacteraceae bacterium]
CHTAVPELNAFGKAFRDAGYRWPSSVAQRGTLPIATKVNLAYTSAKDPAGLPKAIVDEVEFLSFGPIRNHLAYRLEQYWLDGGNVGKTRDAYVEYDSDPLGSWRGSAAANLSIQLGEFTLPLPNDPETMRPTQNHYAVFDQTVGENPFDLFNDGMGVNIGYGNRDASISALVLRGHDPQSGLPIAGTDSMFTTRLGTAALSLWGYQYEGARPIESLADRFIRRGFALTSASGKSQASILLQTGNDSSPFGDGKPHASSGGYLQEEWAFSSRWIGVARYDGASGPNGFVRSTTLSLNYRPYDRARWTIEDVYQTQPQTTHTLNAAWLFAF